MFGDNYTKSISNNGVKINYESPSSNYKIVYDRKGGYFRIQDTTLSGKRVYTDINGADANNKTLPNGKQAGRNQGEYNEATHFKNSDINVPKTKPIPPYYNNDDKKNKK